MPRLRITILLAATLAACATETAPRAVSPPPPPVAPAPQSADCVRRVDVLEVAEQILRENEQHASRLTELEKSMTGLQEQVARTLAASLKALPAGEASVSLVGGRVRVRLSDELLFPSGSAQLGTAGARALTRVADVLRSTPSRRIEVNGHTDSRPVQSQWQDNWQLSTERARQVALLLISRGIEGKRLLIAGYADTDPLETADSPGAWARNRRVELFIEPTAQTTRSEDAEDPKR